MLAFQPKYGHKKIQLEPLPSTRAELIGTVIGWDPRTVTSQAGW